MESLNLKKLLIRSLDWKIIFILHCGYELLTDLYKHFLKFKENVSKYGRITNNSFFGTICTICLGTYTLSKNLLIFWSIIFTGSLLHLKIFLRSSTSIWKFSILEQILKNRKRSVWNNKIKNKILISKNYTKCDFAKNRSNKAFAFAGNFDI